MTPLDKKGNIKGWAADLLFILGAALVLLPPLLQWPIILIVISKVVGLCIIGFASIAIISKTLDLRAFTFDPLGWRKVKMSHKELEAPKSENKPNG